MVGGMHASAIPDDFIYSGSPFDFVVIGEGEKALLNICQGKIKSTGEPRKIVGGRLDLNNIPAPNFKEYKYFYPRETRTVLYALSRGCPFFCSFCIESVKNKSDYRYISIKRAIRNIQGMVSCLGVRRIKFIDACFGVRKEWRKEFLKKLDKEKIKAVFELETRIDLLDMEDIDLLSKLNIRNLYLGIEHASSRMLSLMHKTKDAQTYLENAKKVIKYLNEKDIPNILLFIFNHPGETKDSIQEAIRFLDSTLSKLKRISTTLYAHNYLFTPGTSTYQNIRKYEKEFGTVVKHKTWWKEPYFEQQDLADKILPSKDLYDDNERDAWKKYFYDMQQLCLMRKSDNFLAFDMGCRILLGNRRFNPV